MNPLEPRVGRKWKDEATEAIRRLVDDHPRWDTLRPASVGTSWPPGCYSPERLDLVYRPFLFHGNPSIVVVRLQRGALVRILRALRDEPLGFVIGYGGAGITATYRSCELQAELWHRYQAGIGGKAAPPGESWHNRGLAADAPHNADGAAALAAHGFQVGKVSGDPSHITWQVVG